jgi:hypothetical protein
VRIRAIAQETRLKAAHRTAVTVAQHAMQELVPKRLRAVIIDLVGTLLVR